MKKIKIIVFCLLLMFLVNVKAADTCDKEELARLKELASKIELNYDYEIKEKEEGTKYATYSVIATNLHEDLKALVIKNFYTGDYQEFVYNDTKEAKLSGYSDGERVTVTVKAYVANACATKTVATKSILLPYYNSYYDEETCNKYPEFQYCKTFLTSRISKEKYESELKKYIEKIESEKKSIAANNLRNTLIYIGIGVVIIIVVSVVTWYIMKKRKEDSL